MSSVRRSATSHLPVEKVPQHIGIILDGNGRWARARGLPRLAGHRAGVENLRRVLRATVEFGIPVLTVYAFSTENWGRPEAEVHGLFSLLDRVLEREVAEMHREGVRINHIGRSERIPAGLMRKIRDAVELTSANDRLVLNVAFNYGGRAEIVDAIREIVALGVSPAEIDEALVSDHLYTRGLPDPDLIIRTSGEMRVSNFLVWQGAYAEYYVTPTTWPDFDREELYEALLSYAQRERRMGLVPE
jgi:undecaprenyl diphosphate synthase